MVKTDEELQDVLRPEMVRVQRYSQEITNKYPLMELALESDNMVWLNGRNI